MLANNETDWSPLASPRRRGTAMGQTRPSVDQRVRPVPVEPDRSHEGEAVDDPDMRALDVALEKNAFISLFNMPST